MIPIKPQFKNGNRTFEVDIETHMANISHERIAYLIDTDTKVKVKLPLRSFDKLADFYNENYPELIAF